MSKIIVDGVEMSAAAAECVQEAGSDVQTDLVCLSSGERTRATLLEECLNCADDDRVQGWHDYVDALCDALPMVVHLVASAPSHGDRHVDPDATAKSLSRQRNLAAAQTAAEAYLREHPEAWVQVQRGEDGQVYPVSLD